MSIVVLGSSSSIEAYREEVSEFDPKLDDKWDLALAANQVSGPAKEKNASKAAKLSAITKFRELSGNRECSISTSDDPIVALQEICGSNGVLDNHFASGTSPLWVESDFEALAQMIAGRYGCPIGRPKNWTLEA